MKVASLIVIASALVGCSSGGSSPNGEFMSSSARSASPGGFWVGADSDGEDVIAIVSEDGLFYFLAGRFAEGSGLLTVINGESVNGVLQLPEQPGFEFPNEKLSRDCKLTGSVAERDFMTLDVQCRTEENQQVLTTLELNYDNRYERDSSLATIAGDYSYTAGMVLSIDAIGSVFGQDSVAGRVINGQVTAINTAFNLYGVEWSNVCCVGQDSELIGKVFSGFALLDNTVIPEQLIIAVSSNREDVFVTIISFAERL